VGHRERVAPDRPALVLGQPQRAVVEEPADVERLALAGAGDLEPAANRLCAFDEAVDLRQLVRGERSEPLGGGLVGGAEQVPDLLQREAARRATSTIARQRSTSTV
jgi:hypothetical protein